MRIFHFSDTHGYHEQVEFEDDLKSIDVIVFSGDESNYRNEAFNEAEFYSFIDWYGKIDHPHKLMIPGNHSTYIYNNEKQAKEECEKRGIRLLIHESYTIDNVEFYGEPYTKQFGSWVYTASERTLHDIYDEIPTNTNVLISHGPPRGILDLAQDVRNGEVISVGSDSLAAVITYKLFRLKAVLFGHIHSHVSKYINNGIVYENGDKYVNENILVYSNASGVVDGDFSKLVHKGHIVEI